MTFKRSGARLWLLAFVGFWLLHAGWAFASPLDGPPDELQHVIRAAGVLRGEFLAPTDANGGLQTVPASIDRGWCFPTKVTVPASCERDPGGDETLVPVHTTAARYNPVYYLVTSWPVAIWPSWPGIILSRLLNGAIMAGLLAGAVVAAARWFRHRALLAGVVVAATPMIAHLGGAVNPNGVEIAAGLSLFTAVLALVHEQRDGVNRAAVALAGISAGVLVTPRITGLMWFLVIVGVIIVPSARSRLRELGRSPTLRRWAAVVAVCTIASLAWNVLVRSVDPTTFDHGFTRSELLRFALLDMWPNVANQMVAVTGWAEVLMPRLVYVVWFMSAGLLLMGGLLMGTRVDRWRLLALFFGTFVPLLTLELLIANQIDWFNQGRYFLPGAVGLPLFGAYILARRGFTAEQLRSITRLLVILLLPIQVICLVYTMARWNSGLVSLNPFNGPWQPPYGTALPIACATVAVAVLFLMYWRASRVTSPTPPASPDDKENPVAEPVGATHA